MGGGPSIPQRDLGGELGDIFGAFKSDELPAFRSFANKEPLLKYGSQYALQQLMEMFGQNWLPTLGKEAMTLNKEAMSLLQNQLFPILESGGKLTPEQEGDVRNQTYRQFSELGTLRGPGAIGQELLNRDQFRRQRFQEALGESGQTLGLAGQGLGLLGQGLGLNTQALQDALQTEASRTGNFATLINPLLSYGSDLFSSNQNAAAAQSIAGSNKQSGAVGGGLSALGSIAGALGIAL